MKKMASNYVSDVIKNTNLDNIAGDTLFNYLSDSGNNKEIIISKDFDFDFFKELIRMELVVFNERFYSLREDDDSLSIKDELNSYVEEILSDNKKLTSFSIYKIQQFINSFTSSINLYNPIDTLKVDSKYKKSLKYRDCYFDISNCIGFLSKDKIASSLYKSFDLKKMRIEEYENAMSLRNDESVRENEVYLFEINRLMFKAGVSNNINNEVIYSHPTKKDSDIIEYIRDNNVAEKYKKRVLIKRKEYEDIDL